MQAAVVTHAEKGIATVRSGNLGLSGMLAQIVREEGARGLYKGFTAATAGAGPAHALYYAVYELTKRELGANRGGHRPVSVAAAGAHHSLLHTTLASKTTSSLISVYHPGLRFVQVRSFVWSA